MPTGYTAKVCDGEQSFEEFVLTCARAMGALIMMRDDPFDAEIPDEFSPVTKWHEEQIDRANARLAELRDMTPRGTRRAMQAERERVRQEREEHAQKTVGVRLRLQDMLSKVESWKPPTSEHVRFKQFMVDQLNETIRFDGTDVDWPPFPPYDGWDWKKAEVEKAEKDLAYHTTQIAEEIERTKDRNAWVKALRESLASESKETPS